MTDEGAAPLRIAVAGTAASTPTLPEGLTRATARSDADLIVAFGEHAVIELGRDRCSTPILPVDAGSGIRSVPATDLDAALERVTADEHTTWTTPRLAVTAGDDQLGTAVFDVMFVTEEPAHISEFSVRNPTDPVAQFRADGLLVSTAAGTSGYARRLDAPVMDPEISAAAVVPVAPFATSLDHWTAPIPADGPIVETTIEREEAVVTLLTDDRIVGPVPAHQPLSVNSVDPLTLVSVPESRSCYRTPTRSARDHEQA